MPLNIQDQFERAENEVTELNERARQLEAFIAEYIIKIEELRFERDACQQELFESDRYANWLSMERQALITKLTEEREAIITTFTAEREAILSSTSWKITQPMRLLKKLITGS